MQYRRDKSIIVQKESSPALSDQISSFQTAQTIQVSKAKITNELVVFHARA